MIKSDANIRYFLDELALKNSEQALKALYQAYSDRLMRYIHLYVNSYQDAEELVSDVFITIWENRKEINTIHDFDAYIYRIAKFRALNHLRINHPELVDLDNIPIDLFARTETTPEDDFISREQIEEANRAIEQLPPKTKIAFKLIREDGLRYKDAALHLGISIKTLEAHLTAAVKAIMKTIKL
ncbi:MAG: sigma-70 family RNA polymerase sigma factor [Dysgonamonadaceae bacterium]|jgi:RNA polymerase sigma-70 factor (ECF subfamily)|nr:sigma-70 family RNA polymerase sigma factor [Dysgonamonadaceae bacterium]